MSIFMRDIGLYFAFLEMSFIGLIKSLCSPYKISKECPSILKELQFGYYLYFKSFIELISKVI